MSVSTSPIFSDSSSFIPLFQKEDIENGKTTRTIDVQHCQIYAIPIPMGDDGVYPGDAYSWDEFYGISQKMTMHLYNLQLIFILLAQLECGTPSLTLDAIKTAGNKSEYNKLFKDKKNFVSVTNFGNTFFDFEVAREYERIHNRRSKNQEEEPEVERKSTAKVLRDNNAQANTAPSFSIYENLLQYSQHPDDSGSSDNESSSHSGGNNNNVPLDPNTSVVINFGDTAKTIRSKFDIALLPVFRNPNAETFSEKKLCGAILIVFCFDPLWDMMHAWRTFVSDSDEYHRNTKGKPLHFNAETWMENELTINSSSEKFSSHFRNYVNIDPSLASQIAQHGLEINNPRAVYDMRYLWSYDLALKHMAKFAGKTNDREWLDHYGTDIYDVSKDLQADEFTFNASHHPYVIKYDKFVWNTANIPGATEESKKNPRGVATEFFPWIQEFRFDEIKYFQRVEMMEESQKKSTDLAMTNYVSIFNAIRSDTGSSSHTFVPSQYNAIVATAERVKRPRRKLVEAMQDHVQSNKDTMEYLFRDRYKGAELKTILANQAASIKTNTPPNPPNPNKHSKQNPNPDEQDDAMDIDEPPLKALSKTNAFNIRLSSSPFSKMEEKEEEEEEDKAVLTIHNKVLAALAEKARELHDLEMQINHFMDKRVLTTRNVKPLTPSIKELIKWVDGHDAAAKIPIEGEAIINTEDSKPLRERNLSVYQLSNIHPDLDTMAHAIMYYAAVMRYTGSNANVHDLLILRHGLNDAYRYETNVHFNFAATGPAAASKSHGLKTDKKFRVPGMVTSVTNFSQQALASFGDYSDNITSLDEAPQGIAPKSNQRQTSDFSPEAALWKAILSQGFNVRQILDTGSGHFSERAARLIVCVLIGCIAFAANIVPHDKALMSRFYHAISQGMTDDTIDATKKNTTPAITANTKQGDASNSNEDSIAKTESEKEFTLPQKLDIQDLIFHTPSAEGIQAGNLFKEAMVTEHALVVLVNKLIQSGALPDVSMHMSVVTAKMYKYLKIQMKKSPNLRVMQRPLLLARSMTITRAVNLLFNIPGIFEEFKNKPYELVLLQHVKPFLYCTPQTMLLAFSFLSNEVYQPIESIIVRSVVNNNLGPFPAADFRDLIHHRNLEKAKLESSTDAANVLLPESERKSIETHPIRNHALWPLFRDSEHIPLEAMYRERIYNQVFRVITSRKSNKTTSGSGQTSSGPIAEAVAKAQQAESSNNNSTNTEDHIDLNYINLNISLNELVNTLFNRIKPTIERDNIYDTLNSLKSRKLKALAIPPMSNQALNNMGAEDVLPRVEREMNMLETVENDRYCYLCVHIFDEILDKSDSANMVEQAFRSIFFQRMEPRTYLIGTEVTKNFDVEFKILKVTHEDLLDKPKYLTLVDPTQIQNKMNDANNLLIKTITSNIEKLVVENNAEIKKKNKFIDSDALTKGQRKAHKKKENDVLSHSTGFSLEKDILEHSLHERQEVDEIMEMIDPNDNTNDYTSESDTHIPPKNGRVKDKGKEKEKPKEKKKKDPSHYVTIKEDLDTWAIKQHFKTVGIPMKFDEETGEVLCKLPNLFKESEWTALPTPAELAKKHKNSNGKVYEKLPLSTRQEGDNQNPNKNRNTSEEKNENSDDTPMPDANNGEDQEDLEFLADLEQQLKQKKKTYLKRKTRDDEDEDEGEIKGKARAQKRQKKIVQSSEQSNTTTESSRSAMIVDD